MISLIMPIKSSESEINGAMEVYLNLRSIWSTIGNLKVGQNGQVYIVNSNGIIIAHKDPLIVLSGQYVLDKEIVRKLITDKQTVDGLGPESDYINNGVEVFGVGVPIEDFNWGVIVEQPWQDALAARTNIILLAGISLGMGLGLLILIQITINQLLKASASLEIEKQKAEELSRDLEEKIYTRTAELNQEKASLEIKVMDRTKQMQEKVKELEKTTELLEDEKQKQLELSQALEIKVKARTAELNEEKAGLETKIADRTREMQEKVQELERFQKFVVGRELKMVELKQEIRKLQQEIDENKKHLTI
jgi:methyl-accepting chemotaxis protein